MTSEYLQYHIGYFEGSFMVVFPFFLNLTAPGHYMHLLYEKEQHLSTSFKRF